MAIRTIYHDMLMKQQSTPTALAIASVATSAFNIEKIVLLQSRQNPLVLVQPWGQ